MFVPDDDETERTGPRPAPARRASTSARGAIAIVVLVAAVLGGVAVALSGRTPATTDLGRTNPELDPGTRLSGLAPGFRLTDQFGRAVSLRAFRGKVVILAFNDSECTTICPLTTAAMADARAMLGRAASRVQLLGVNANPTATSVADVRRYTELHGLTRQWHFLTGTPAELRRVWRAYKIESSIEQGQIDHTPALFVIDPAGRLTTLFVTQQSYAAVPQLGQLLAEAASWLLPGHPAVRTRLSYSQITGVPPGQAVIAPRARGGTVTLGATGKPRLYVFFATWDAQVMPLKARLEALRGYQANAVRKRLPLLTAVDEGSVEPSTRTLTNFLNSFRHPLTYPVAIDRSGRIADGYEVQDEPWLVLVSATGRIAWYDDIATSGWPGRIGLSRQVRQALAVTGRRATDAAATRAALTGSPPRLAALHAQADRLLSGEPNLAARIRSLHGLPIVLNAWGSWCGSCRAEFGLLARAAVQYGRRIAFLGADLNDSAGDASAFLAEHQVSYPSYEMSSSQLTKIVPAGLLGTPTTIFFDAAGRIAHVHTGEYAASGSLNGDIETYALGQ